MTNPDDIIARHFCRCCWFRAWSRNSQGTLSFTHPEYGWVTGRRAAELDIKTHNCASYEVAVARVRKLNDTPQAAA